MLSFSVNPEAKIVKGLSKIVRPTTQHGREWLGEFYLKAIEGKTREESDIDAYGHTCNENQQKTRLKREVPILSSSELEKELRGVSEAVATYTDENLERIVDTLEVSEFLEEFEDVREYLFLEEEVDFLQLLRTALDTSSIYNSEAVSYFRDVVKEFKLTELVTDILENEDYKKALQIQVN